MHTRTLKKYSNSHCITIDTHTHTHHHHHRRTLPLPSCPSPWPARPGSGEPEGGWRCSAWPTATAALPASPPRPRCRWPRWCTWWPRYLRTPPAPVTTVIRLKHAQPGYLFTPSSSTSHSDCPRDGGSAEYWRMRRTDRQVLFTFSQFTCETAACLMLWRRRKKASLQNICTVLLFLNTRHSSVTSFVF